MQIITMNNETTATGYHYAVSDALLEIGKTYNMVIFHANTDSKYWGTIVK